MPATLQPVIVTPSLPLLLAFDRALFGAVEISLTPDQCPRSTWACRSATPNLAWWRTGRRILTRRSGSANRDVGDLNVGDVDGLLEHVEALGGRVLGPPNDMPWGQRVAHIQDPDKTVNLTQPISARPSAAGA